MEETIEEAAEKYANMHEDVSKKAGLYLVKAIFQDGAKWQQEKSSDEEEAEWKKERSYDINCS